MRSWSWLGDYAVEHSEFPAMSRQLLEPVAALMEVAGLHPMVDDQVDDGVVDL
jgi:hypothetical protein